MTSNRTPSQAHYDRSDAKTAETIDGQSGALLPTPPRIDLKTIDDVRVEMARVYRDMRTGKVDTADGTKLAYVLAQLGKLIDSHELQQRIEALETVLKTRKLTDAAARKTLR